MNLNENIASVQSRIRAAALRAGRDPAEVTLVAATKVQTSETIRAAIAAGVRICGENRVQEMAAHLDDDAYAGARL
ncbi:MAG: YggS family pyridoxal phosphate-dependent enzyme, partial [Oscillospiraceae bacterium]